MSTTDHTPATATARRDALLARADALRSDAERCRTELAERELDHRRALAAATLAGAALPARPAALARLEDRAAGLSGAADALAAEAAAMAGAIREEVQAEAVAEYHRAVEHYATVRDRSLALLVAGLLAIPGVEDLPADDLLNLAEHSLGRLADPLALGRPVWGSDLPPIAPALCLADLRYRLAARLADAGVVDPASWSAPGERLLIEAAPVPPADADAVRIRALLILGGAP